MTYEIILIYSEESFVGFFLEGGILSSYILFTFLFPIPANKSRTSGSRESRVRDLTLDTLTPKDLWTPEHFIQHKSPRFIETQSGSTKKTKIKPH